MFVVIACVKAEALCKWDRASYNLNLEGGKRAPAPGGWRGGLAGAEGKGPGRRVGGVDGAGPRPAASQQRDFSGREMQFADTGPAPCCPPITAA